MSTQTPTDPRFIDKEDDSHLRERMQKAEQAAPLRPGALCPHCGGHPFKRAELKAGAPRPPRGKETRNAPPTTPRPLWIFAGETGLQGRAPWRPPAAAGPGSAPLPAPP